MTYQIQGEQPFQILATNFSIGPSENGYTLQISADGKNYSDLFSVGANVTRMVTGVSSGSYYRLKNNTGKVAVNWERQCNDGGSGGGSYILPVASETTLGGIKVGEGLSIDGNGVLSSQGGGSIDSGAVLSLVNSAITDFSNDLQEGEPIVGMAKQLYSPDGVDVEAAYIYRTTGGDKDVSTGVAELRKLEAYSVYPEKSYDDSATLTRGGEEVEGFEAIFEWGDFSEWEEKSFAEIPNYSATTKTARFDLTKGTGIPAFICSNNNYYNWSYQTQGGSLSVWEHCTDNGDGTYTLNDIPNGWAEYDGTYLTIHLEDTDVTVVRMSDFSYEYGDILFTSTIPNDIPFGESTYTYDDSTSAWTPTLPQAVASMTLNSDPYEPEDGDEITITRSVYAEEVARHSFPEKFVALGLNSFDKDVNERPEGWVSLTQLEDNGDDTYTVTINAVTDLNDGYVIYSETSAITEVTMLNDDGATLEDYGIEDKVITGETISIAYPYTADEALGIFHYIRITTTDIDTLCVHPRWSGYMDEVYEPYTESVVDLYDMVGEGDGEIIEADFFYPRDYMWSVGNVRNTVDLVNNTFTMYVKQSEYSQEAIEQLIEDGKVLGVDFDFDDNNIYEVMDEPMIYNNLSGITYRYEANDFSVEYWVDIDSQIMAENKIGCENYYMNNLVDKLRRMKSDYVILDNLDGQGEEGVIYNYGDQLFVWNNNSGYTGEWTSSFGNAQWNNIGFRFGAIPEGQKILEFKDYSGSVWRSVNYEGGNLVLRENDSTFVQSAATGTVTYFSTYNNSGRGLRVKFEKNYIGFTQNNQYISYQNVWDGSVNGGHFVPVENTNYPYFYEGGSGIATWNEKGQIIRGEGINRKWFQINGSSYRHRIEMSYFGENSFPSNIWAPTTVGTSGQVLVSSGDADTAPTWATMIKAVQITSDAYDALVQAGTTDPNVLYLIVDE